MKRKEEHISRYASILSNKIRREIDSMSFRDQFSGSEGRALHFLLANDDRDVFQKDLEEEFCLRPSSASALIRKMEQDGLITRVPVAFDGRYKKILLTEKAMQYKDDVVKGLNALETHLIGNIPKEDLEKWVQITMQLIENL